MMEGGISAPFIRHPIATSLLMVGILFAGIVAYPRLPVAPLPQVDFPTIQVSVQLPGASPDTMASAVAQPLETQFAQISGVAQMTSLSTVGSTVITIQFDLGRNIDGASNDVQAAINAAGGQLPKDLPTPPTYRKVNPTDSPILLLAATSDTLPLTEVDDIVETKLAQTIRASVQDVQFTLLLTVVLVVMVIFAFLRSPWATVIPSVTVPLALLGACALMWFMNYSLDNLSLMALTISVGFVVDDAIVMLISRAMSKETPGGSLHIDRTRLRGAVERL